MNIQKVRYLLEVLDDASKVVPVIPVDGQVKIGLGSRDRTPDVVIPPACQSASRDHAVIKLGGDIPVLTDNSKFGTVVNGRRIVNSSVDLHDGDEIDFGLDADCWRVRFRVADYTSNFDGTITADPLELLSVSDNPWKISIGRSPISEHLGGYAFHLLKFLADHKGSWYPKEKLARALWPDPDHAPYLVDTTLSDCKKEINDLLKPHLKGQDAILSRPDSSYRMKPRLEGIRANKEGEKNG